MAKATSFSKAKLSIRQLLGNRKSLKGVVVTHFEDLADYSTDLDVMVVGIVENESRSRSAQKVNTDLCVSGKRGWKPGIGELVDFAYDAECGKTGHLIVTPSQL